MPLYQLANLNRASEVPNDVIEYFFATHHNSEELRSKINDTELTNPDRISFIQSISTKYLLQLFRELVNSQCLNLAENELLFAVTLYEDIGESIKAHLLQ